MWRDQSPQQFVTVPLNDCVMFICEGIMKLRNGRINPYNPNEWICHLHGENQLFLDISKMGLIDITKVAGTIRFSQVQLFIYLLHLWKISRNSPITMDENRYFAFRNIRRRPENVIRLQEDLEVLQSIHISIMGKMKNKPYLATGALLKGYQKKGKEICVTLGDFINYLTPNVFTYLNTRFFHYHPKHHWMAGLLSLKFAQLSKLGTHKIRIGTIADFLGITDEQYKKQGQQYYTQLLERSLQTLSGEGYHINLQTSNMMESVIEFKMNSINDGQHLEIHEHAKVS